MRWISSASVAGAFVFIVTVLYVIRVIVTLLRLRCGRGSRVPADSSPDDNEGKWDSLASVQPPPDAPAATATAYIALGVSLCRWCTDLLVIAAVKSEKDAKNVLAKLRRRGLRLLTAVPAVFYMRMTTLALQSFLCVANSVTGVSAKRVLAFDMTVQCLTGSHIPLLAASVAVFVVLSLGLPFAIVAILNVKREILSTHVRAVPSLVANPSTAYVFVFACVLQGLLNKLGHLYELAMDPFYVLPPATQFIALVAIAIGASVLSYVAIGSFVVETAPLVFLFFLLVTNNFRGHAQ